MNHTAGIRGELTGKAAAGLRRRPRPEGFTLTEIMIALGVLVTGMSMVAGALHAGIQNHTTTVDDIVRCLVAENGLATIKARIRHTPDAANGLTGTPVVLPDAVGTNPGLGPQDRRSPAFGGGCGTPYGYSVIGWRATDPKNDYRFVILPYKIVPSDAGGQPAAGGYAGATLLSGNNGPEFVVSGTVTMANFTSDTDVPAPGGVVICLLGTTGKVAIGVVASKAGLSATLKGLLVDEGGNNLTGVRDVVTLTPKDSLGNPDTGAGIETLKPYQCRTSLEP
jgi:prepilin-type N-terminal cleavage/methylation domain-containing protein